MTRKEGVIIGAYTNILCGKFSDLHEYIEKIMGRPVWTHELADKTVWEEIKEKSKSDFMNLLETMGE